jgi:hypothetical protein
VTAQDVTWDNCGSQAEDNYIFTYGNGNAIHHFGTGLLYIRESGEADKKVEFVNNKMMYTI